MSDAAAGSMLLFIFICGTVAGIFVIVCWASGRDSLSRRPPGNASGGVRRLIGVGRREEEPERSPESSGERAGQERELKW